MAIHLRIISESWKHLCPRGSMASILLSRNMDTTPISNQALLEIQMKSKILCYLTIHKYNHWCRSMLGGLQLYRECLRCGKKWIQDRKSTRLNSSHSSISYAVFCLKKKTKN